MSVSTNSNLCPVRKTNNVRVCSSFYCISVLMYPTSSISSCSSSRPSHHFYFFFHAHHIWQSVFRIKKVRPTCQKLPYEQHGKELVKGWGEKAFLAETREHSDLTDSTWASDKSRCNSTRGKVQTRCSGNDWDHIQSKTMDYSSGQTAEKRTHCERKYEKYILHSQRRASFWIVMHVSYG